MIFRRTGFTLLELMIVIAIIGVIASVLYPQLTRYYARGRDSARLSDIKTLSANIQNYSRAQSVYPSNTNKDGDISYCMSDIAGWTDALQQFRDKQFSKL
jgi:prepilin-type N-terminal cleavage/methylation domain-containing protein